MGVHRPARGPNAPPQRVGRIAAAVGAREQYFGLRLPSEPGGELRLETRLRDHASLSTVRFLRCNALYCSRSESRPVSLPTAFSRSVAQLELGRPWFVRFGWWWPAYDANARHNVCPRRLHRGVRRRLRCDCLYPLFCQTAGRRGFVRAKRRSRSTQIQRRYSKHPPRLE